MWSYEVFESEAYPSKTYQWHGFNLIKVFIDNVHQYDIPIDSDCDCLRKNILDAIELDEKKPLNWWSN